MRDSPDSGAHLGLDALAQIRQRQDLACREAVAAWHGAVEASLDTLLHREGVAARDIVIEDRPGLVTRIVVNGVPRFEHRLIFTLDGNPNG